MSTPGSFVSSVDHSESGARLAGADALLARASRVLTGSLDVDHLVDRLLGLLVPDVVGWAQLTIHEGRGRHRVASRSAADRQVRRTSWVPPLTDRRSVPGVLATGRRVRLPALVPDELDGLLPRAQRDDLTPLLPGEAIVLPLLARGTVFGTLVLAGKAGTAVTDPASLPVWDDLAERASLAIDTARLYGKRRHALDVLQRGLHPPSLPVVEGLRMAAFHRPADAAGGFGGDFYDVHGEAGEWTVVLGDVSGKGVQAGVLAGRARQTIRTAAVVDRSPQAILTLLNRVLVSSADPLDEDFITLVCGRLRRAERGWDLELSSAGHPPPLLRCADGQVAPVEVSGTVVGLVADSSHPLRTIHLAPGDTLLLYTDGVTEARDATGELFGTDNVLRLLGELPVADPEAMVAHVARAALEWAASSSHDDVALLAVHVDPLAP